MRRERGPPSSHLMPVFADRGEGLQRDDGRTRVCSRRPTASAALPLPGAAETWRSASKVQKTILESSYSHKQEGNADGA